MPYLTPEDRSRLDASGYAMKPGELNYELTKLVDQYITRKGLSYTHISEAIGALECAKLELYRRVAAPYEDKKARENGEVYFNA